MDRLKFVIFYPSINSKTEKWNMVFFWRLTKKYQRSQLQDNVFQIFFCFQFGWKTQPFCKNIVYSLKQNNCLPKRQKCSHASFVNFVFANAGLRDIGDHRLRKKNLKNIFCKRNLGPTVYKLFSSASEKVFFLQASKYLDFNACARASQGEIKVAV